MFDCAREESKEGKKGKGESEEKGRRRKKKEEEGRGRKRKERDRRRESRGRNRNRPLRKKRNRDRVTIGKEQRVYVRSLLGHNAHACGPIKRERDAYLLRHRRCCWQKHPSPLAAFSLSTS